MRNTKKAISILLTLLMVVGMMSTFAFAATTKGSITVDNPQAGKTYTAYKVFDATNSGNNWSYSIASDSKWFNIVDTYFKKSGSKLSLQNITGTNKYIATFTDNSESTAADFAKDLATELAKITDDNDKPSGTDLTIGNDGKAKAEGLDLGYYFVTTTSGSLCMLTSSNDNPTIHDKNAGSDFGKTATKINNVEVTNATTGNTVSAKIGDVISYEIKVNVPSTQGYAKQDYIVSDKMSDGLTYNVGSILFTINGSQIVPADTITLLTDTDEKFDANKTFQYKIDMTKLQGYVGKTIKITYTATVNSNAADKNTNTAGLEKNDPTGGFVSEPDSTVTVTTGTIKVIKVDATNTNKTLPGAKFVLKNGNGTDAKYYKAYKKDASDNESPLTAITENTRVDRVEWVDEANATILTTDDSGNVYFKGLEAATTGTKYYLVEIEAPEGYNMLKDSVEVTVTAGTETTTITPQDATVENSTGTELPETGGIGTTIFYILGAILVIGAGVVFVTRRRMHSDK